jgi:hypothetical protein
MDEAYEYLIVVSERGVPVTASAHAAYLTAAATARLLAHRGDRTVSILRREANCVRAYEAYQRADRWEALKEGVGV